MTRGSQNLTAHLPDACTIAAPDEKGAANPVTGIHDAPIAGAVSYTGPCMVSQKATEVSSTIEHGGQDRQLESHRVRIPNTATTPDLGDIITVTASVLNPDMIGLEFEITGLHPTSVMISKILGCRSRERSPRVV